MLSTSQLTFLIPLSLKVTDQCQGCLLYLHVYTTKHSAHSSLVPRLTFACFFLADGKKSGAGYEYLLEAIHVIIFVQIIFDLHSLNGFAILAYLHQCCILILVEISSNSEKKVRLSKI